MRLFVTSTVALVVVSVMLAGALAFILTTASPKTATESVSTLDGPLGFKVYDLKDESLSFYEVRQISPDAPLPSVVKPSWFVAEGDLKVLAVDNLSGLAKNPVAVLDKTELRMFVQEAIRLVNAEHVTLSALGSGTLVRNYESGLVVIGPVLHVNGSAKRAVIEMREVDSADLTMRIPFQPLTLSSELG